MTPADGPVSSHRDAGTASRGTPDGHHSGGDPGGEPAEATGAGHRNQRSPWRRFPLRLHESWSRRTAPWRQTVQRRRTMLHDELVRLDLTEEQQPERCVLIEVLLADADTASFERTTMARWWWGTEIERAWARLREVEERSTDLLPDNEVVVRAVAALANATPRLATSDPRRIKLAELIDQADRATDVNPALASQLRAATVAVLRASHANADFMHHQARGLRNRTLLGSVITVVVAGLVVLGQAHLATTSLLDQPDDWSNSSWQYMILVMLLGCVGALFTAIPAMSKVPTDSSPFNMPLQQAILKIVFGAVAAVVGLAIVNTDIVQSDLTNSMPGVVVLGVVFGAGQQIVTQFVDREAKQILGTTYSEQPPSTTVKASTQRM